MSKSRKQFFIEELKKHYQEIISGAHRSESEAAKAAEAIQKDARRKEDAKAAVNEARLEAGHRRRRLQAKQELEKLIRFAAQGLFTYAPDSVVGLGAMIDVSVETDDGSEERTLFLLPVGAGTELHGPGGDGFISVISPQSPIGQALKGARVGDDIEVVVGGRDREWTIVDLY